MTKIDLNNINEIFSKNVEEILFIKQSSVLMRELYEEADSGIYVTITE